MVVQTKDIKKTGATKTEAPVKKVVEKQTDSEIYLLGCDEEQAEIFNEIKAVLMAPGKGNKREYEAVDESRFDDFDSIIKHIRNGVVKIEEDGIRYELRQPLDNKDGISITDNIKILFERNVALETIFKKSVKTHKKSDDYDSDMGAAVIAASFEKVGNSPISANLFMRLKNTNELDYEIIVSLYIFFRR